MMGQVEQMKRDMLRLAATDPDGFGEVLSDLVQRVETLEADATRRGSQARPFLPSTLTVAGPKPQVVLGIREAQAAARRAAHDQWRAIHPLTKILRVAVTSCRARTWGQRSGATLYHVEGYVRTVTGRATWDADVSPQDGTVVGITIR